MTDKNIKIEGIEELIKSLESIIPEYQQKAGRSAMRQVGREMAKEITKRVPVDTGALKDSIRPKLPKITNYGIRVSAGADYAKGGNHAHLVEFGHKQVFRAGFGRYINKGEAPGQPFIRPALYANKEKYVKLILEATDKALSKLERKAAKQGRSIQK